MLTATELIHLTYKGNFTLECNATVLECRPAATAESCSDGESDVVEIVLDRTVLHPQGGGQPTDHGAISSGDVSVEIDRVTSDRETGIVLHAGKISGEGSPRLPFRPGDKVTVVVDADRRRLLSECHSAGHVIDQAMARIGRRMPPTKVRSDQWA